MQRNRKLALAGALLIPVVGGGFFLQARPQREGAALLDQVMTLVAERFVDTLPQPDVYEKAAAGLVKELNDPYSELLTPRDLKQFNSRTGGRYGGLGMLIEPEPVTKTVRVVTVYPNTPAEAGGVHEGDLIIRVDTVPTRGWTINQVSDSLTGTPGTKVKVTFARPVSPTPINGTFTRAIIRFRPFRTRSPSTTRSATSRSSSSTRTLPKMRCRRSCARGKGREELIIDLRGDQGGILEQSLQVANMFIPQGSAHRLGEGT
jgi:carboxyl-terminal processing protease